ncbi:MAG: RecX family transcriptional regulator [Armatimonadetes bacterium]|nr:RecX family transcriptional regulator [Armatimonadota bacterium]
MTWSGDQSNALALALKKLQSGDRLEQEIRDLLATENFSEDVQNEVISSLQNWSLLNDSRTAGNRTEILQRRGYGKLKILEDLERRGAPPDVLASVDSLCEPDVEVETARKALSGKNRSKIQAARFLASRGFEQEVIEQVIENLESYSE